MRSAEPTPITSVATSIPPLAIVSRVPPPASWPHVALTVTTHSGDGNPADGGGLTGELREGAVPDVLPSLRCLEDTVAAEVDHDVVRDGFAGVGAEDDVPVGEQTSQRLPFACQAELTGRRTLELLCQAGSVSEPRFGSIATWVRCGCLFPGTSGKRSSSGGIALRRTSGRCFLDERSDLGFCGVIE